MTRKLTILTLFLSLTLCWSQKQIRLPADPVYLKAGDNVQLSIIGNVITVSSVPSAAGGGITTFNGLNSLTQTVSIDSASNTWKITSSGSTHTIGFPGTRLVFLDKNNVFSSVDLTGIDSLSGRVLVLTGNATVSGVASIGGAVNSNVGLTIRGLRTSANNVFSVYLGYDTLQAADGWSAYGLDASPVIYIPAGDTLISAAGVNINLTKTGAGSAARAYGILVENVAFADTANYAIYTKTGDVRFGDTVNIAFGVLQFGGITAIDANGVGSFGGTDVITAKSNTAVLEIDGADGTLTEGVSELSENAGNFAISTAGSMYFYLDNDNTSSTNQWRWVKDTTVGQDAGYLVMNLDQSGNLTTIGGGSFGGDVFLSPDNTALVRIQGTDGSPNETTYELYEIGGTAHIASVAGMRFFIDADGSSTNQQFVLYKDTALVNTNAQLLAIGEDGLMSFNRGNSTLSTFRFKATNATANALSIERSGSSTAIVDIDTSGSITAFGYGDFGGAVISDSSFTINERSDTPSLPTSNTQIKMYMKGDKFIWVINAAGTPRYYYFDATATASQSVLYSATEP